MSNSLAIAAVTATLRQLLESGINSDPALNFTEVTTRTPDRAREDTATGNQLNLFLYHTTLSAAWRNREMPGQARPGEAGYPPLPLNLYYLVSAYGRDQDEVVSHRILGRAMGVLHDHPLLDPDAIVAALPESDLNLQVDRVRVRPQPMTLEDQSRLWTAFSTKYRISACYEVAVVLIESTRPLLAAPPVLRRGPEDRGPEARSDLTPPFPTLTAVLPPQEEVAAKLVETLILQGYHLNGDSLVLRFAHPQLAAPLEISVPGPTPERELPFTIPNDPANWPAGVYRLSIIVRRAGEADRVTNEMPFALAPDITLAPTTAPAGTLTLTITCRPDIRPDQRVALLFGSREIPADSRTAPTGTLVFTVTDTRPGEQFVRLRVDGIDSRLVDRSVTPPRFLDNQKVMITP